MVNSSENKIVFKPTTTTTILQGSSRNFVSSNMRIRGFTNGENSDKVVFFVLDGKFGQEMKREKRRVLGVINHNLVGARAYPCVINKRGSLSKYNFFTKSPI